MANSGNGGDDSTLASFDKILSDAQSAFDRVNRVLLAPPVSQLEREKAPVEVDPSTSAKCSRS